MVRLIDADKIQYTSIAHLASYPVAPSPCDTVMRAEINAMPTVDAVPVIRCKDCKWFVHDDDCYGDCSNEGGAKGFVYTTDYCSRAERKDNG